MGYKLEICVNSMESALAAQRGGADRIELCDNMAEGGTTPSIGMAKVCKKVLQIPVFPIIRPRGGDFNYSAEEFEIMKEDILAFKELGCEGVVFGILRPDRTIDIERCAILVALARPMQVTFHRAFDCCNDLKKGLNDIIALGCDRLLTSGGSEYAFDAISVLKQLIRQAQGSIIVVPGSGIREDNISYISNGTGASEYHSTAKSLQISDENQDSIMKCSLFQTDEGKVRAMREVLNLI